MPGVKAVYHRQNIGKLFRAAPAVGFSGILDEKRPPFEDNVVRYYGQYVAAVVALTFEQAVAAANAVDVRYEAAPINVSTRLTAARRWRSRRSTRIAAIRMRRLRRRR